MKTVLIDKNETLKAIEITNEKINCPICGLPEACMVECQTHREHTEPPSKKMIQRTLISFLCVSCGYTTNTDLEINSIALANAIKSSPQLVVDLKIVDMERNVVWFPSVLNFPEKGVIYPDGIVENWKWVVSPYEPIPENELYYDVINGVESNMPLYTHKVAIEKSVRFDKLDFQSALNVLNGILIGDSNGK